MKPLTKILLSFSLFLLISSPLFLPAQTALSDPKTPPQKADAPEPASPEPASNGATNPQTPGKITGTPKKEKANNADTDYTPSAEDFGLDAIQNTSSGNFASIEGVMVAIINWLIGLAGAIAFVMVVVSGILYLTSYGNEDKATSAKKALLGVAIGSILVAGALFIVKLFIVLIKTGRVA